MNIREKTILNLYLKDTEFFNEINNYIDSLVSENLTDTIIISRLIYFIAPEHWNITNKLTEKIVKNYLYGENI